MQQAASNTCSTGPGGDVRPHPNEFRVPIEDDFSDTTVATKQPRKSCSCCSCCPKKQEDDPLDRQISRPEHNPYPVVENQYSRSDEQTFNAEHCDRKWKHFTGNNRFYCEGRVMTAPSIRYFLFCCALILLTVSLFMIFDAPFLAEKFTIAIPIITAVLLVIVLVNMLRTTCSDPGILPRASKDEIECLERSYENNSASRPPPRTKDIIVKGQTVKSKYCFTCKMFRPPRASHCSICDNCVDRFDHHCPFLGNCIGRRNYKSFYFFVVSLSLLAIFILAFSIAHIAILSKEHGNFLQAIKETPLSAVVVLISFFGMWTVLGLSGFHTYLICVEQTTNEDIKGLFGKPNSNPYSRGSTAQNCCFLLCGPIPPSLIDPRGLATAEFLRSLPKSTSSNQQQPVVNSARPLNSNSAGSFSPRASEFHNTGSGIRNAAVTSEEASQVLVNTHVLRNSSFPVSRTDGKPMSPIGSSNLPIGSSSSGSHSALGVNGGASNVVPKSGTFPDSTRIGRAISSASEAKSNGSSYYSGTTSLDTADADQDTRLSSTVVLELKEPVHSNGTARSSARSGDPMLDDLTMINSPLHLDSIM